MIINHNMNAMNAHRLMSSNTSNAGKSMEKLSSGLRINRAGDDAAGLAISEKMRGQIRGLDQASRNSQDGISMLQTAEGALNETHSILQRMRELAVQSGNDTNVGVDRGEIQKEMNQLSSEINRIGNTTEFNTQKVLAGDGKVNVAKTGKINEAALATGETKLTQVSQLTTMGASVAGDTAKFILNGQELTVTFAASITGQLSGSTSKVTANSATAYYKSSGSTAGDIGAATKAALEKMIAANDTLRGNYDVTDAGTGKVTIKATAGGAFDGAAGNLAQVTTTGSGTAAVTGGLAAVGTTENIKATGTITITAGTTGKDVIGKGMTINNQAIEFYDGSKGAYTGNALGIDVKDADVVADLGSAIATQAGTKLTGVTITNAAGVLTVTANQGGVSGNSIKVTDGGVQKNFEATLQVGANQGQQFKVDVNDMRAAAIAVTATAGSTDATTGAKYTTSNTVTNGTDSTTREAALDVSDSKSATNAVKTLNNAIEKVSAERSKLGAFQNRLEHTIANLGTSSENLTAAESRVRDVDMAKEMMSFSKNNILSQAAQAMLAQANQQPQGVLQLLK